MTWVKKLNEDITKDINNVKKKLKRNHQKQRCHQLQ